MEDNQKARKERRVLVARVVQMAMLPRPLIEFYVKVLEIRDSFRPPAAATPDNGGNEGHAIPRSPIEQFVIDTGGCMQALDKILAVKPGKHPVLRDQLNGMRVLFSEGAFEDGALFRQTARGEYQDMDRLAVDRMLDEGLLRFVVHSAVKAVAAAPLRAASEGGRFSEWRQGRCPVCGSLPHLVYATAEEQHRTLCCSLCGQQWQTDRTLCPLCGDDAPHAVRIESAVVGGMWAEGCPPTGFYIKAADLSAPFLTKDASINDLASIRLDYAAMEEGFTRPGPIPC